MFTDHYNLVTLSYKELSHGVSTLWYQFMLRQYSLYDLCIHKLMKFPRLINMTTLPQEIINNILEAIRIPGAFFLPAKQITNVDMNMETLYNVPLSKLWTCELFLGEYLVQTLYNSFPFRKYELFEVINPLYVTDDYYKISVRGQLLVNPTWKTLKTAVHNHIRKEDKNYSGIKLRFVKLVEKDGGLTLEWDWDTGFRLPNYLVRH